MYIIYFTDETCWWCDDYYEFRMMLYNMKREWEKIKEVYLIQYDPSTYGVEVTPDKQLLIYDLDTDEDLTDSDERYPAEILVKHRLDLSHLYYKVHRNI